MKTQIKTIFESELPISVQLVEFKKSVIYNDIISTIEHINKQLKKLERFRKLLKIIRDNYDLFDDIVGIEVDHEVAVINMRIKWNDCITIEIDKEFVEENSINADIDNIEEVLDKIEEKLQEEKRRALKFIKELSRRNLLKIEIEDKEEEDEEEDC